MMKALKEWATVVKALESGNQTVLLRKGGILETASGFKLEARKFFFFPTYEHQQETSLKLQFQNYLTEVEKNRPNNNFYKINSYAEVIEDYDIQNTEKVKELSPFHIWSDSYIFERMNWLPEKPIKAIFLKVFRIDPVTIPLENEYQGCKSWIDINVNIETGEAVLSNEEIHEKIEKFRKAVS